MSQNDIMIKIKKILVWTMWGLAAAMFLSLLIKITPSGYEGKNAFSLSVRSVWAVTTLISTTGRAVAVLIMLLITSALLWFKQSYLILSSYVTAMVAFIISCSINGSVKGYFGKVGPGAVFLLIFAILYFIAALGLLGLTVYRLVRIGQRTHRFEIYPYEVVLENVARVPHEPTPTSGYGQQSYAQPQQPYAQPQQPYAQPQQPYAQPQQPQQPQTKFCTSCGTPNVATARFCARCGNPLT